MYIFIKVESVWRKISSNAKDMIKKMIERDMEKRMCVETALQHPWIHDN
jgi:serine/threonine protein kinase